MKKYQWVVIKEWFREKMSMSVYEGMISGKCELVVRRNYFVKQCE